jgi:hypothetical protein
MQVFPSLPRWGPPVDLAGSDLVAGLAGPDAQPDGQVGLCCHLPTEAAASFSLPRPEVNTSSVSRSWATDQGRIRVSSRRYAVRLVAM